MNAAGTLTVNVDGREVAITCIHVGVDLPRVQQALSSPNFEIDVNKWREKFPGKTVIAGEIEIDSCGVFVLCDYYLSIRDIITVRTHK